MLNLSKSNTDHAHDVTIHQGEYLVSRDPNVCISTLVGSCIAVCLFDAESRVGGMNHFLLPEQRGGSLSLEHYGAHAMELLINGMLKAGASRENLTAKAFGGASIQKDLGSVGEQNAKFVLSYLNLEGIDCIANSLGGHQGRLIRFYPASGRAQQMFIGDPPVVAPPKEYNQSDITFFED